MVLSKYERICPCQEGKDYLGIASIYPKCTHLSNAKLEKLRRLFFMGNGIKIKDAREAARHLLFRDHKDLAYLNIDYYNGKLGAKFLPPMFFSGIPKVSNFKEYQEHYATKAEKGLYSDQIKGVLAEKFVFNELKKYHGNSKDDVLIVHSHKFLGSKTTKEKDFIILNLSKGYIFIIEVKANANKFQLAKKQLLDSKERIEELFGTLGLNSPSWKYAGVFIAQDGSVDSVFNCNDCSKFAIIGLDNLSEKLKRMEEEVLTSQRIWNPAEHVDEFILLSQQLLFHAQGNPGAPVTGCNIVNATCKDLESASNLKSTFFLTPQQLSLIEDGEEYVILDATYSTGKTTILKHHVLLLIEKKQIVFFFVHRTSENLTSRLPITMILEEEFKGKVEVKETEFQFEKDSTTEFLEKYGIEPTHHVVFDELICLENCQTFVNSIRKMKKKVASLWIAMGAKPNLGTFPIQPLEDAGFQCPKLRYPLRNPLKISEYAQQVMMNAPKNGFDGLLQNEIDVSQDLHNNITEGQLIIIKDIYESCIDATVAGLAKIPAEKFALAFINITGIRHSISLNIKTAFYLRNDPIIYKGPVDEDIFKTWMLQPSQRKSDLCLVGTANKINGIETDIVVHIIPAKCSFCKVSSEDPVIISRAKAMLIVSTYRGSTCEKCKKSASQQTLDSLADSSCANSLKSSQLTLISEKIRR